MPRPCPHVCADGQRCCPEQVVVANFFSVRRAKTRRDEVPALLAGDSRQTWFAAGFIERVNREKCFPLCKNSYFFSTSLAFVPTPHIFECNQHHRWQPPKIDPIQPLIRPSRLPMVVLIGSDQPPPDLPPSHWGPVMRLFKAGNHRMHPILSIKGIRLDSIPITIVLVESWTNREKCDWRALRIQIVKWIANAMTNKEIRWKWNAGVVQHLLRQKNISIWWMLLWGIDEHTDHTWSTHFNLGMDDEYILTTLYRYSSLEMSIYYNIYMHVCTS